ncbi:alpha/beta hydrolase [Streptomyces sp. AC555_RSS877]|uniref:alpha/beta hydrolase n=1 Tax=Streptomyces sp. AC555_RSS877 TaxID=2823688 RepID=UPI0027E54D94|nr:alpha/beta hydrolase [Streptomyces sp. AC555_RSS877]
MCLAGGPGEDVRSLGNLAGLDRHRTLILMEARAAGASEVPANPASCAYTEQAHDLGYLRSHLGADRIDVLAHSAGALTAQHYAASHPDRVRRLVLVTPAGRIGREVDPDEVASLRSLRAGEPWYRSAAEAAERLAAGASGDDIEQCLARFRYATWNDETRTHHGADRVRPPAWPFEAFYRGNPAPNEVAERLRLLRSVSVPASVLAGAADCVAGTRAPALAASLYLARSVGSRARREPLPVAGRTEALPRTR